MFLVMSAAYVTQELKSEFGSLPPSFLPLGNRRLFQHQVALAPRNSQIFLTLPESFEIPSFDRAWLTDNGVKVITIPDGLSLGASLIMALNLVEEGLKAPLHVLFGDTLIESLPAGEDLVAVSSVEDNYDWAVVTEDDDNWLVSSKNALVDREQLVVAGYFRFSNPRQLIRCVTQAKYNLLDGLGRYRKLMGLSAIKVKGWLDFGHVNTFYRSKSARTTQRNFNELAIKPNWVEKSGNNSLKIEAEAIWFENIPSMVRLYTPQYLGRPADKEGVGYRLEYLHQTPLNELYVFADIPPILWRKILKECFSFLSVCAKYENPIYPENGKQLRAIFTKKTKERLKVYYDLRSRALDTPFTYIPDAPVSQRKMKLSLNDLVSGSDANLPANGWHSTLVHGDLCFSNILYDFRTNRIKVIDPRGLDPSGELSIYGDIRYDVAKLSHSVLGLYDWIIAGRYELHVLGREISISFPESTRLNEIQQIFLELVEAKFSISPRELYAMQVQLFLSMLPLHSDDPDRQFALLVNAFRLYDLMESQEE